MFYGTVYSNPSPWSEVFTTLPLAKPSYVQGPVLAADASTGGREPRYRMSLSFAEPMDDGGTDILGSVSNLIFKILKNK